MDIILGICPFQKELSIPQTHLMPLKSSIEPRKYLSYAEYIIISIRYNSKYRSICIFFSYI